MPNYELIFQKEKTEGERDLIVDQMLSLLEKEKCTIHDAKSILNSVSNMIEHISLVKSYL